MAGLRGVTLTVLAAALIIGSVISVPAAYDGQTTGSTGNTTTAGTTGAGTTGATTTGNPTNGSPTTGNPTTGAATTGAATTGAATTGAATTGAATTTTGSTGAMTGGATTGQNTGQTTGTTPPTTGTPATTTGTTTAGDQTTGAPAPAATTPPTTPPATAPTTAPIGAPTPNVPTAFSDLKFYGREYFLDARKQVDERRKTPGAPAQVNALTGPVGPDTMAGSNVSIPFPDRYLLGPGDTLQVRFSSPVQAATSADLKVDERGSIIVPQANSRLTVRGQTLAQVTNALQIELRKYLRGAVVDVQLKELRTISVRILGEAYAPGTYELPSIITLFNALYAAGGPSDTGTFRNIQLKRQNGATRRVDLYRLLMTGDSSQDIPLQPGDIILLPPASSLVAIRGEVKRPAIYELLPGERLKEAIALAGGAKPSGVTQRVSVESVRPGIERRQVDANLLKGTKADNPPLYDGDSVEIFSIRDVILNSVSINGAVDQPRTFAFTKGMHISDLLRLSRGVLPNASFERADLYRMNPDGSTRIVPFNLSMALKKDPKNDLELRALDSITVYSTSDVTYLGTRRMVISGAVQKPGQYYRSDNSTVRDLIMKGGGLLPTANTKAGYLRRTNPDGTPGPLLRLDLDEVMKGIPTQNVTLQDDDDLQVFTVLETQYVAPQSVDIAGNVQRPGGYKLASGLRVADLINYSGGLLPDSDTQKGFLQRTNENGLPGPMVTIDIAKALSGDPEANLALQPRDKLTIFKLAETQFILPQSVEISGNVQRAGAYTLSQGMQVRDLLNFAGGPMLDSDYAHAWLQRINPDGTNGALVPIDLTKAIQADPKYNLVLQPRDKLTVFKITETAYRVAEQVTIAGAVQRAGMYPSNSNMKLKDLIAVAGGVLPNASETVEVMHAWSALGAPTQRIRLADVLADVPTANIPVVAGDTFTLPGRSDVELRPRIVNVFGAVKFPGPYMLTGANDRLSFLVRRAGGLTEKSFPDGTEFLRDPKYLTTQKQLALTPRLAETIRLVADDEYQRATALADLDRLRIVFSQGASISSGSNILPSTSIGGQQAFQPGASLDQALAKALASQAATKARVFGDKELVPIGNLNIDLSGALSAPGSKRDVILQDGDVIVIPEKPTTVTVSGAVVLPSSVVFEPNRPIEYYIDRAGGMTNDASLKEAIIIRATGALVKYKPGVRIKLGDNILIPSKVLAVRLSEKQNDLQTIASTFTSAGLTLALIKSITK